MANILVVDDVDFFRRSLVDVIKGEGHTVFEAKDGNEAIKIIKEDKMQLILLDVVMPNKGGVETLFEVKSHLEGVKIIIMSGKISPDSDAFYNFVKQFGASAVLYKPFKMEKLIEEINSALAS